MLRHPSLELVKGQIFSSYFLLFSMKDRIAVIMGSSKGIGRAIALAFAKSKNYSGIVTNARYQNEAQAVSDEIRNTGCNSFAVEADVSKEDDSVRLIRESV